MRLKKNVIGNRYFTDSVDITDPCYDRDTWCRMNGVKIKPGNYKCIVWMRPDKFVHEGKKYDDTRVATIGIYLDGNIPYANEMEEIGEIGTTNFIRILGKILIHTVY